MKLNSKLLSKSFRIAFIKIHERTYTVKFSFNTNVISCFLKIYFILMRIRAEKKIGPDPNPDSVFKQLFSRFTNYLN